MTSDVPALLGTVQLCTCFAGSRCPSDRGWNYGHRPPVRRLASAGWYLRAQFRHIVAGDRRRYARRSTGLTLPNAIAS
ncbi:hypothetical protein [Xylella fastidiosa]|uniref:hypothetical protein n=1 Tax=Xylella fastidiosa TaxID=2371 RepID=UPI003AFA39F5